TWTPPGPTRTCRRSSPGPARSGSSSVSTVTGEQHAFPLARVPAQRKGRESHLPADEALPATREHLRRVYPRAVSPHRPAPDPPSWAGVRGERHVSDPLGHEARTLC